MIPSIKVTKPKSHSTAETKKKEKGPTEKQVNTSKIIHQCLAHYDELQRKYKMDSSAETKAELYEYSQHIRSQLQLALLTQEYILAHPEEKTLIHISKIRELIKNEVEQGQIIKVDKILRNPKTVPYENISASGNVVTIHMAPKHIEPIMQKLVVELADFPVQIINPCNNMIMIIELGPITAKIDNTLFMRVKKLIMTFALDKDLHPFTSQKKYTFYLK